MPPLFQHTALARSFLAMSNSKPRQDRIIYRIGDHLLQRSMPNLYWLGRQSGRRLSANGMVVAPRLQCTLMGLEGLYFMHCFDIMAATGGPYQSQWSEACYKWPFQELGPKSGRKVITQQMQAHNADIFVEETHGWRHPPSGFLSIQDSLLL
jgi:hypothetical protein